MSRAEVAIALLILLVVLGMFALMLDDLDALVCELLEDGSDVGPRHDRVPQPSLLGRANGWASAEGNEAGTGANRPREWPLARSRPYDQLHDLIDEVST